MGMNASTIIDDNMTLDEKLAAIDAAMQSAMQTQAVAASDDDDSTNVSAPVDPSTLFMCEGCQ